MSPPSTYQAAFSTSALRAVVMTLQPAPEQAQLLLAGTGMDEAALMRGDGFLSWSVVHKLISNLLQLSPPSGLALEAGYSVIPTLHGPMGIAAMSSDTLDEAMHTFSKYMASRSQVLVVEMREEPSCQVMSYRLLPEDDEVRRFLMQCTVASSMACIEFLLGEKVQGVELCFNWPEPADISAYEKIFHGNVLRFSAAEAEIWLPAHYMQRPLLSRDRQMRAIAAQQCDAIKESLRRQGLFSESILTHLRAQEGAIPSLQETAAFLNLSERTVIRRLKEEGTRYQDLADSEASRRAAFLLGLPGATVAAVAAQLGYAEPASFRRAFRRWFGVTPSEFRA
ncbi:MAG: AraC family transcriptional regulator ligand-binding domain-containing protein [Moraxellaceae bacterium]